MIRDVIKNICSFVFTFICLKNVKHGNSCKCNFMCKFTRNTVLGENCHFNGIEITGTGKVFIGNNFHSGKRVRLLTSYHNYDCGSALPYDDTYITKDIVIEDNVWIGQDVIILAGVTIGEGAVIQAGSVVCKNIPPLAIAGGHPANVFKMRNQEHYNKLKIEGCFW